MRGAGSRERDELQADEGSLGPFAGTRVLEVTTTVAGQTAGMLLADLGAEVVRIVTPASLVEPWEPGSLCRDRSKLRAVLEIARSRELGRLARMADVIVSDLSPSRLVESGLSTSQVFSAETAAVHVWMPPVASSGPESELPGDPLLLEGIAGFASHFAASEERPVASVAPLVSYLHGALGALAAAGGLVARERGAPNQSAIVSGLHATAAALNTIMLDSLDLDRVVSVGRGLRAGASFRIYQAGDGRWFFLAGLSPEIFFRALDAIGRMDLMIRDDVGGEFSNILIPEVGNAVGAELEATFALQPAEHWLEIFRSADVPAAAVSTRAEWMASDVVRELGGRLELEHPVLGPVTIPGIPLTFSETPCRVRHLPDDDHVVAPEAIWLDAEPPRPRSAARSWRPGALPLEGLRVVDLSTFLAAPMAAALLADAGAEVVKLEPPSGDPYRVYSLAHLAANQRKRMLSLDLRRAEAREAFFALLGSADVLIDNLRPGSLERLGIDEGSLSAANPRLVRSSLSAFGQSAGWAQLPGFDPLMQVLSGLAEAQGGDWEPITIAAPTHDVIGGALAALGALGALLVRERTGAAQRVFTSLAASTLLQTTELTSYEGRPPAARGGFDHPGPTSTHRFVRADGGWLALAARTDAEVRSLLEVLGHLEWGELAPASLRARLDEAIAGRPASAWAQELSAAGVPASTVLERQGELDAPLLVDSGFSHIVLDPDFGRVRVVRAYAQWPGGGEPPTAASRSIGHDSRELLEELGLSRGAIDELLASGAAVQDF